MKRIVCEVDDKLHLALRQYCLLKHTTAKEVLTNIVETLIELQDKEITTEEIVKKAIKPVESEDMEKWVNNIVIYEAIRREKLVNKTLDKCAKMNIPSISGAYYYITFVVLEDFNKRINLLIKRLRKYALHGEDEEIEVFTTSYRYPYGRKFLKFRFRTNEIINHLMYAGFVLHLKQFHTRLYKVTKNFRCKND